MSKPWRASSSATPRPMPRLAPVMNATGVVMPILPTRSSGAELAQMMVEMNAVHPGPAAQRDSTEEHVGGFARRVCFERLDKALHGFTQPGALRFEVVFRRRRQAAGRLDPAAG